MVINFIYYVFFSSAILVYGMGLQKTVMKSRKPKNLLQDFCKFTITISISTLWVYFINGLLIRINFGELYPFLAILIISVINLFMALIVKISPRTMTFDLSVELLCVIIGTTEASSVWEALLNSLFCMVSYFVCIPFFYGLRKRIEMNEPTKNMRNLELLFVSLGIIVLVLMAWNVSWLNPGNYSAN